MLRAHRRDGRRVAGERRSTWLLVAAVSLCHGEGCFLSLSSPGGCGGNSRFRISADGLKKDLILHVFHPVLIRG